MAKKRKRTNTTSSQAHGGSTDKKQPRTSRHNNQEPKELDLRGKAATTDSLQAYLKTNFKKNSRGKSGGCFSVQTDHFPRGCMQVLLDHMSADSSSKITSFENHYGKVYKHQLQNPDLKLLVKTNGSSLTHLCMIPPSEESSAPKLQGCGYRWITQYATKLQVLELSLKYDVKKQLLDLSSRRTPLQVHQMERLILRDVGPNTTMEHLVELVEKAPRLRELVLWNVELDLEDDDNESEDLSSLLQAKARDAGNSKLRVHVN